MSEEAFCAECKKEVEIKVIWRRNGCLVILIKHEQPGRNPAKPCE